MITVVWGVGKCAMTAYLWHQVVLQILPSVLGVYRQPVPCHHNNAPCILNLHSCGNLHVSSYNFLLDYLQDNSARVAVIMVYFSGTLPLCLPPSSEWHGPFSLWCTWNWCALRHIRMTSSNGTLFSVGRCPPSLLLHRRILYFHAAGNDQGSAPGRCFPSLPWLGSCWWSKAPTWATWPFLSG